MSNVHIYQANHNERFYVELCKSYPDDFFDWKLTVLFYQAFHYIKALALHKGIDIGDTHKAIIGNIRPNRGKMPIKKDVFDAYSCLMNYSWSSRYKGFVDSQKFKRMMEIDHIEAIRNCAYIKDYVKGRGVDVG